MLKKTIFAILNLVVSSYASAGDMGPACIPGDVSVPCEVRAWDIGAEALYLQTTYTAHRAYEFNPDRGYNKVEPRWGWGYRLQGSYHFYTGNDVTISYIHYDKTSERGGYAEEVPYGLAFEPFRLKLDNKFDQVNLSLGQHVDISALKKIRFYGGLQFAKIRGDATNYFSVVPTALLLRQVSSLQQYRNADFEGLGPVFGMDYSFYLTPNLSLTGNAATSLLTGVNRYVSNYILGPAGLVSGVVSHSYQAVVPSLEAKLGLNYGFTCAHGTFNLEGGFQAINYFNALETRRVTGNTFEVDSSDFGLYGPYLGAHWVGFLI